MGYGQGGRGGGKPQYDNNMKGALFTNNEKRRGKKDPDMRGQCEIEGVEYWLDAWWNESKSGDEYLSVKMRPKDDGGFEQGSRGGNNSRGAGRGGGDRPDSNRGSGGGRNSNDGGGNRGSYGGRRDSGMPEDMDEDPIPY